MGKKFQVGNVDSSTEKRDSSCLCFWTILGWLARNKTLTQCGMYWANQQPTLTTFIWVVLNENAKRAKILWTITEICLNPGSLQEQKKSYLVHGNLTQTSLHGPMTWKVMQRNVRSDIASWRTKQSTMTQSLSPCLMIINSSRKNSNLWENYQKFAHPLS